MLTYSGRLPYRLPSTTGQLRFSGHHKQLPQAAIHNCRLVLCFAMLHLAQLLH